MIATKLRSAGQVSGWAFLSAAGGIALAAVVSDVIFSYIDYAYPAIPMSHEEAMLLQPFVEDGWIKIPSHVVRKKDCSARSTVTLRRMTDYGGVLGKREDVINLGNANTTLTPIGSFNEMFWYPLHSASPIPPGKWTVDGKAQDDCGGLFNFDFSVQRPRTRVIGDINIP